MSVATPKVEFFAGPVSALGRHMGVLRMTPGKVVRPPYTHTALLLDCSISMTGSIASLRADACNFVDGLEDTNYVSVIVFSGHDRARLLSGPTRCDSSGKELIGKAIREGVRIMDVTVFSEPLELVLKHLSQSKITGMASQAVLFTDGCAVPERWGVETEQRRAFAAARALYEFGAAVSVIGYGYYYDADFVTRLMQAGGSSGVFRHMNDVEDFGEVIRDIRDTFARLDLTDISLRVRPTGHVAVSAFYRTLPELTLLSSEAGQTIKTRGWFDGSLTLYLDVSGPVESVQVLGEVSGDELTVLLDVQPLTAEMEADCVRVTAAHLVLSGQTEEAIELLTQTGDDGVAETVANAFTQRDRRTTNDRVRRAFRDRRFIGAGLKPSGPSHNVLNVLRALMEDPAVIVSIPAGTYKRGGLLVNDPRVVASPLGSTVRVVSYSSSQERLNFSIKTQKDVSVLPVDDEGNIIDGTEPVTTYVYRDYNLVRDGELVMKTILASMSERTFSELQEAGVIDASLDYQPNRSYTLNLGDLPMVSSAWARPSSLRLVDLLREEAELKAEQTALNAYIKCLDKPDVPDIGDDGYREHATVVEGAARETYLAPIVELRLMRYKAEYADDTAGLTVDQAIARVKEVRRRLRTVRFLSRSIKFACHLTGWKTVNWSAPQRAPRSDKFEQLAAFGGAQLKLVTGELEVIAS